MKSEIEATFIDIDKDQLRSQLKALGGKLLQQETLMRRVVFNVADPKNWNNSFARVRDEGNRVTMTYKRVDDLSLSGTREINLEVNSYDDAVEFLKNCGLHAKSYEETYREEWELDGVELDIDTWPWLPTFVEIEGPSEAAVQAAAEKLGFAMDDAIYGSVDEVYKNYFDVTSRQINTSPSYRFEDEIPAWLSEHRRPQPLLVRKSK